MPIDAQAGGARDGSEAAGVVARVDGIALHAAGARPDAAELRQRACTELLRQAAQRAGLLAGDDAASEDGVVSEAAASAIEALLERELRVPEPGEDDCRRYHAANPARFADGERVLARHILFAVTPGVDVNALLPRAEQMLLKLRCGDDTREAGDPGEAGEAGEGGSHEGSSPAGDAFATAAREWSNCPSGAEGGALGWLRSTDCVPEFARELFAQPVVGVLPRLVRSRFGLHVVEVLAREPGVARPFEAVRGAVALALRQQAWTTALRQYLRLLAAGASVEGVDLDAADTPLVQ
ncbi:MAG: peptidylprolyl isomerase [Burkholderiaceae bacterium]